MARPNIVKQMITTFINRREAMKVAKDQGIVAG